VALLVHIVLLGVLGVLGFPAAVGPECVIEGDDIRNCTYLGLHRLNPEKVQLCS
jgi:hypothetical protein